MGKIVFDLDTGDVVATDWRCGGYYWRCGGYIWRCGGYFGRAPDFGFKSGISHNDPGALLDHCEIL